MSAGRGAEALCAALATLYGRSSLGPVPAGQRRRPRPRGAALGFAWWAAVYLALLPLLGLGMLGAGAGRGVTAGLWALPLFLACGVLAVAFRRVADGGGR
ncbi:MAG: hypothetical protein U0531_00790 [Dehalococcoidia bacterium]